MTDVRIVPVVVSGGAGTRLWPLSTREQPKQFHALFGGRTLFQETVARLSRSEAAGVSFTAPVVICSDDHVDVVAAELAEMGVEPAAIVAEPVPRGTAPAAAVAAELARELDPDALVLFAPSDHRMSDPAALHEAVARGAVAARERIVTFGIVPSEPATGYGYVRRAEPLGDGVFGVGQFTEKPDRERAEAYLASGEFLWNAGLFLFTPRVLLRELIQHRPDIKQGAHSAFIAAARDESVVRLDRAAFETCASESIDYAVMENTDRAAVVPCDPGWADVGSWSALWRLSGRDERENAIRGRGVVVEGSGNLVWAGTRPVVLLGVQDMVVVETAEAVVVLPRSRAEEVKRMLEAAAGSAEEEC